jgi:hypothetical protein
MFNEDKSAIISSKVRAVQHAHCGTRVLKERLRLWPQQGRHPTSLCVSMCVQHNITIGAYSLAVCAGLLYMCFLLILFLSPIHLIADDRLLQGVRGECCYSFDLPLVTAH